MLGERQCLDASLLDSHWGLGGHPAFGTLVSTAASTDTLARVRAHLDEPTTALCAAATLLPELLVVRAHARCATRLRSLFIGLWQELRQAQDGRPPPLPRIWAT